MTPGTAIAAALRAAQRQARALEHAALDGCALTDYEILLALDHDRPLKLDELHHAIAIDRSVLSRRIGALAKNGLVRRRRRRDDARAVALTLTERGARRRARWWAAVCDFERSTAARDLLLPAPAEAAA